MPGLRTKFQQRTCEVQAFVNTTEISQHSCWYQSVQEPFGYNGDAPHVSVGPEDLPKEVRMMDGANPPPAHNWHLERTNTAVKRSAHALVTGNWTEKSLECPQRLVLQDHHRNSWSTIYMPLYSTCNFCFVFAWNQRNAFFRLHLPFAWGSSF